MSAKSIMVQGTMSNSGKSFVAAGLCRVFHQDGYQTAPFKSQNMALNSYITKEGLEMGRAQVMQAEAAGIEPSALMNPILLKPTSQMGSQVIVNGEVYGNMKAMDYYRRKTQFIPLVKETYEKLASQYDVVVLEGAGSPAEINLKDNDIVNMGMARMAKSPVLLVADIDRGGVFASIYGTVKLLEPEEQAMIKGIIINKFRGDKKILEPGLRMIEEKVGIPVVGVIPMEKIDIDDEDSLSERLGVTEAAGPIDVAVIHLPHISNFTDFAVLERMKQVSLRYVERESKLGRPSLVILPGTKNTMNDMKWLRQSGLEAAIKKLSSQGVPVFGICGGYQMLGEELHDPMGVEQGGSLKGMGLLPLKTTFAETKTRTQIAGTVLDRCSLLRDAGETVTGYEIHMGVTEPTAGEEREKEEGNGLPVIPLFRLADGRIDGCRNEAGTVFGTYLHGIFDSTQVVKSVVDYLMEQAGLNPDEEFEDVKTVKEREYDKLADLIRGSLNMDKIYEILQAGLE